MIFLFLFPSAFISLKNIYLYLNRLQTVEIGGNIFQLADYIKENDHFPLKKLKIGSFQYKDQETASPQLKVFTKSLKDSCQLDSFEW